MEYEDFIKKYGPNFNSFSNGVSSFVLTWDDAKENVYLILKREPEEDGNKIVEMITSPELITSVVFKTAELAGSEDVFFEEEDGSRCSEATPIWIIKVTVDTDNVEL
jgi:hypothetical protein